MYSWSCVSYLVIFVFVVSLLPYLVTYMHLLIWNYALSLSFCLFKVIFLEFVRLLVFLMCEYF